MIRSVLRNKPAIKAIAAALACVAAQAHALQPLDGDDGATLYAKVSKKEVTRIFAERGRISSLRVKDGELNIAGDDDTGQLFVTVPDGVSKPINGFLTTEDGRTFNIILQPTDIPGDSIVVKQSRAKVAKAAESVFKTNTYDKVAKRLISVMANDELPDDMEIKEVGRQLALWKETSMTLERQYNLENTVGERYIVSNVSKEPMVLDEREFYRKGVSVVAIEQLNIAPGDATHVYIIRERAPNE
jgi:conjugal transfer pilus assembly protein TraK